MHWVTESLKPVDEFSGGASGVEAVEIVLSQLPIRCIGAKHLESNDEDLVSGSDDGLGPPSPRFNAMEKCRHVACLAVGCSPGGLRQNAP